MSRYFVKAELANLPSLLLEDVGNCGPSRALTTGYWLFHRPIMASFVAPGENRCRPLPILSPPRTTMSSSCSAIWTPCSKSAGAPQPGPYQGRMDRNRAVLHGGQAVEVPQRRRHRPLPGDRRAATGSLLQAGTGRAEMPERSRAYPLFAAGRTTSIFTPPFNSACCVCTFPSLLIPTRPSLSTDSG